MNNVRGLYPPLFGATPSGGGGGGGQHIQVDALPEASLQYKDKIVQYTGPTTETITNGYFYKCVEHTETEGETITVTYSWDNIPVMEADGGYKLVASVTSDGVKTYQALFAELMTNAAISNSKIYLLKLGGFSQLYYETSRISNNKIGFYQIYRNVAGIFTDDIILSSTLSDNVYKQNDYDVSESVPSEGRTFKLFSISVDSAIQ